MRRRFLKILLIAGAAVIILTGILYVINGSLEMFPTYEVKEKAGIGAAVIIIFGVIIGAAGLIV